MNVNPNNEESMSAPSMTTSEAAEFLGVTASTVARLIRGGRLDATVRSGCYQIDAASVRRFARERSAAAPIAHVPPTARNRTTFTTGQVAAVCQVAPRTVSKWFDSGKLKGYRIPGSQDRRIPREQLIRFLKDSGMPLPPWLDAPRLVCLGAAVEPPDGWIVEAAADLFALGSLASGAAAVLFDLAVGRAACLSAAAGLRKSKPAPALIALHYEDDDGSGLEVFDLVMDANPDAPRVVREFLAASR